jgi:hypothetical protein
MLLAIATFLASPAGQDPNREPMWFDGCAKIVEVQTKSDEWIYFCGDDVPQEETIEEWTEEPNEEVEQFSFKKQTKALPKIKAKPVKATKAGTKTKRTNASKLPKSNSKAKPRISFY